MKNADVNGGTPNWAALANTQIASGRYFTDIENNHHATVAVIGNDVKTNLFGDGDPHRQDLQDRRPPFYRDWSSGAQGRRLRPNAGRIRGYPD